MADLVLTGSIVDGTGAEPFPGWVAVDGDRIERVGRLAEPAPQASRTLGGSSLVVAPGFVDVHNHSDLSPFLLPEMPSTLRQGVTSVVVGNCGSSPWPLAAWDEAVGLAYGEPDAISPPCWDGWRDYLDAIDRARPAVNLATLVGHGSVRWEVLGLERRAPSSAELDRMRGLVRDAVTDGAVGLSTGLIYVPGIFSRTNEVVALAAAAADVGGLYASHIRGEGRDLFDAVAEALEIGERASLPVHVSHLKCESSRVWGRAQELLGMLHNAPDATGDQYPYTAWNSSLASLLPPWAPAAHIGTITRTEGARLRASVEMGEPGFQSSIDGVGWDRIVLVTAPHPAWRGRHVAAIAEDLRVEPFGAFVRLLETDPEISCIGHAMTEDDVRTIARDPGVFVASDASATAPDGPGSDLPVHPRDYGTFPRALAMAREGLLPLETMVRKMSALPAERFGLRDRGTIRAGAFADMVIFDPAVVRDTATFDDPHAYPDRLAAVVVNGTVAWEAGDGRIARAGRALRRT
jgi:N-acyl-D-amino-acid deacylase